MGVLNLILFVFVFANQLIGGFNTQLPPPKYGNVISILSIDGGGIRGVIPSVVLQHLEKDLQVVSKDENAALADYFDVIAGTSTGGLIAALLASPNPNDTTRPRLTTPEILSFYKNYGPSIFNLTREWDENTLGPKYDGKFLHSKARELLNDTRLHQTLTNVVIPTFELKKVHPLIFSSFKLKIVPSLDAKMSDIAIGTSAAPTLLPPYSFANDGTVFNLVDGAVAASSPSFVAVNEVLQQVKEKNPNFVKAKEPTKILLLSVGCGSTETIGFDAWFAQYFFTANSWTLPLLEGLGIAAGNMNEYHLATFFSQSTDNYYLRIEEYNLDKSLSSPDNVTEENLDNLEKAGQDLLTQTVKTMNTISFVPEERPSEGTNAEALKRLAETLFNEKQLRLKKKSMEKIGRRPFIEMVGSV